MPRSSPPAPSFPRRRLGLLLWHARPAQAGPPNAWPNHRHNFLKQMKYVQEGLLSDPPGMDMYLVVGIHPITRLAMLRTLRNSSDLEGHFLHYFRAVHPTAKGSKWPIPARANELVRFCLVAESGSSCRPDEGHWPLVALAHRRPRRRLPRMAARDRPATPASPVEADGTRRKPCTFRGIDFEMQNLRADAGGKGIPILALRSDADFNAVMRVPELVLRYDWPALAR